MTLTNRRILLSCLVFAAVFARESEAQVVYNKLHDILGLAVANGSASGILTGPVADKFTQQFKSDGSLYVNAQVIKSYQREGCKRLNVVLTKKDVNTPKGSTDANLRMKMNYCIDGSMPKDLE